MASDPYRPKRILSMTSGGSSPRRSAMTGMPRIVATRDAVRFERIQSLTDSAANLERSLVCGYRARRLAKGAE
jgi:hypothetical protein